MLLDMPSAKAWSYEKHQAVAAFAEANGIPFLDMNIEAKEGRFLSIGQRIPKMRAAT